MGVFDTILLPTDGSSSAERGAEQALALAQEYGASIHVLHVIDTSTLPLDSHSKSTLQSLEQQGEKSVTEITERATDLDIESCTGVVTEGVPHREILLYADKYDVDLIVMGTHGRSGLAHMFLGSVTERVVKLATVPVLTVR